MRYRRERFSVKFTALKHAVKDVRKMIDKEGIDQPTQDQVRTLLDEIMQKTDQAKQLYQPAMKIAKDHKRHARQQKRKDYRRNYKAILNKLAQDQKALMDREWPDTVAA